MPGSGLHERLNAAAAGRSFRHLADLTGTNAETVRRYMQGQAPSVEFLSALCRSLGVCADWLLSGRGPMKSADLRRYALDEADPSELLTAMANTIELLLQRVERLEVYAQTLEARLTSMPAIGTTTRQGGATDGGADSPSSARVRVIRDALAQRPPQASD